jgi:hypothetical protein
MSANRAKKGRVYQSTKTRQRQAMAGSARAWKRTRASQSVNGFPAVKFMMNYMMIQVLECEDSLPCLDIKN